MNAIRIDDDDDVGFEPRPQPPKPVAAPAPDHMALLRDRVEQIAHDSAALAAESRTALAEIQRTLSTPAPPRPRGKWRFTVNRDEHGRITTIEVEPQ